MTSSPDPVSRRRRAANGGFLRWTVTLRPAIRILGSFRPDLEFWVVLVVLFPLLCMLLVSAVRTIPSSAGQQRDAGAHSLGVWPALVGNRVGHLVAWPGGILVPRFTGTLFVLCVAGVVLTTLLAGFVCWSLGNSAPALAPAMFVGAAIVHQAIRRPHFTGGIWMSDPGVCDDVRQRGFRRRTHSRLVADAVSLLSHAWIQLPALIGAGLIVPRAYRALVREPTVIDRAPWSPSGHGRLSA